jgi:hypothetical protein
MAKRKTAKTQQSVVDTAADAVEPMVIAMAEQLGTFLGRVQKQADGWLENPALRQQVSQIREGATQLLARVNRAGTEARKSATRMMPVAKRSAKKAKRAAKPAHRKTAETADLFDPRLGEPMGAQVRQKAKRRRRS